VVADCRSAGVCLGGGSEAGCNDRLRQRTTLDVVAAAGLSS
jgi:hypothetical protein